MPRYKYTVESKPDGEGTILTYGDSFKEAIDEGIKDHGGGFVFKYEVRGSGRAGDLINPKLIGYCDAENGFIHQNAFHKFFPKYWRRMHREALQT